MGSTVAVAGASGAIGGELLRFIDRHPVLEAVTLAAGTQAGVPVTDVHPDLAGFAGRVFEPTDPERLGEADVVFLALPPGASAQLVQALPATTRVVDLGNDFRLRDAATWVEFFETPHAGTWCYGLPELPGARSRISGAMRVAAPGCYATAVLLATVPLVVAGLAEPSDVVVTALSGTSVEGTAQRRSAKPAPAGRQLLTAMRAYQVGGTHGTVPEVEQELAEAAGRNATVSFTPMLGPMPRGIQATCSIRLTGTASTADLREAIAATYAGSPFVVLQPEGRWPSTGSVTGTNCARIQVAAEPRAGRAVVQAVLDNLGKGGAGQAVQDTNLMLGLPEAAGLST